MTKGRGTTTRIFNLFVNNLSGRVANSRLIHAAAINQTRPHWYGRGNSLLSFVRNRLERKNRATVW